MSTTEEINTPIEYRLYMYSDGTLRKVGKGKTGPRPHQFTDFESISDHVIFLKEKYRGYQKTQFVVVEWFGPYDSKIYTIL